MYKSLNNGRALKEPEMYQHLLPRIYILSKLFDLSFLFFSFPFSLFLFNIWWTMFPSPVPAEGNKELRCWSNGLFVTLMKYYSQLYHPLATRCWQGPRSHPEALSWPITSLNMLLLLPSRGCTSPASCPGGQAAHQSLGCAALSAHVSPGKVRKTCRKRNAGRKDRSVLIQNIDVLKVVCCFFHLL